MSPAELAEELISLVAKSQGVTLDAKELATAASQVASSLAELLSSRAKKAAEQAGDDAAATIDTEDEAEAELRKS